MIVNKFFWILRFTKEGSFFQNSSPGINFLEETSICRWRLLQNFLKLYDQKDLHIKELSQYAFEKDNLKLLKKDNDGKIMSFGFFKKQ
jgi:hypothetical protein